MKEHILLLGLICILLGLVAATLAAVINVALFSRYRATYFQLLAAGLIGKVAGLLILLVVDLMFHEQIAIHQQPQRMWTIPVYTMLLGLIVGTLRTWRVTHRNRS